VQSVYIYFPSPSAHLRALLISICTLLDNFVAVSFSVSLIDPHKGGSISLRDKTIQDFDQHPPAAALVISCFMPPHIQKKLVSVKKTLFHHCTVVVK
jgi:hypothetical protein